MSLCGGIIPTGEVNVPVEFAIHLTFFTVLAGLFVAPVVLAIRLFRKNFFGQSVIFYLGERLWYCASFTLIGYMLLSFIDPVQFNTTALMVLLLVFMATISFAAIVYLGKLLNDKRFYCSINGFATLFLVTSFIAIIASLCFKA